MHERMFGHNRQIAVRNLRVKEEMRQRMVAFLGDKSCVDKTMEVSLLVARGHSWERILEEIAKCEVVCGNCHRRRTHDGADTYRSRLRRPPRTLDG